MNRRRALKTLFCSSAALSLNLQSEAEAKVASKAIHLLAIGDFGTGGSDQKAVAKAMREFVVSKKIQPAGLWMLGDNIYGSTIERAAKDRAEKAWKEAKELEKQKDGPKAKPKDSYYKESSKDAFSVKSKRWQTDIEEMYPRSIFPGPQWAVLGNHDYHDNIGGEKVQLAYAKKEGVRWHMPEKWYRVDLGSPEPLVTFLAVDTNFPVISGTKHKKTGKIQSHMSEKEHAKQNEWLKAELAKPRAPFTVVVGHHPLYSNGIHRDTKPLIEEWGKLFQEHKVHAYLCGHDHDMQHLELEGLFTSFILSGGGGARVRELTNKERKMPYGDHLNGFTHIQIEPHSLTISHHALNGGVLHRLVKKQDGKVIV
ncbi:Calcineurin-like phosphoesterase [Prosthecobacter debontii]|uniref:Calcineurin-like phosphoesterase n=1 Tax=Prosthecobacter debontii TaxID=48467 RepID=A0A1T4YK28_9BACT|nr:metallophosphoesterase [Prosthecobacter debontii]SKB02149.1 Calcineurin-like phosphoesterase [Prosthecobacter debontii]